MNIIIVEDEKISADRLALMLAQIDKDISIISKLASVKETVSWLDKNPLPDLAFMDIELLDGNSFEIFEKTNFPAPVIFTTGFNEFVFKAFKLNSIDYLLKPIGIKELTAALEKFKSLRANSLYPIISKEIIESTRSLIIKDYKKRFIIKKGSHLVTVPIENILCFYSIEKATFLLTIDKHKYLIEYSLEQLESLVNPELFFRPNRKYIIRMDAIHDIISYSSNRLKILIKNIDDDVIVSREKVSSFKQWLDK